jgi:type IV secretory pathway TrbD component
VFVFNYLVAVKTNPDVEVTETAVVEVVNAPITTIELLNGVLASVYDLVATIWAVVGFKTLMIF